MTKIGYARLPAGQDAAVQVKPLNAAGCKSVYVDRASGKADRPELGAAIASLWAGDQLVVCQLDRLAQSLGHLVAIVVELGDRGVGFSSLADGIDTTTRHGQVIARTFAALAACDAALASERTRPGREAASAKGPRKGGRPTVLTPAKLAIAKAMLWTGEHTMSDIAAAIGVSRATLYRGLPRLGG